MACNALRAGLNKAADLVIEEIGRGGDATPEQDAVNLLVNVFGAMLDNPDTTVDEVMDANYAGDGESGAEMVRSWWDWGRPDYSFCKLQCRGLWWVTKGGD